MAEQVPQRVVLSEDDKNAINTVLDMEQEIREDIARAKAAGIDIGETEAQFDRDITRARAIKQSFFPNG
jgi:predicted amidohydrolase